MSQDRPTVPGVPVGVDELEQWVARLEAAAASDEPVAVEDPGFADRLLDPGADRGTVQALAARLDAATELLEQRRGEAVAEMRRLAALPR